MPPKGEVAVQGPWTAEAETAAFNTLLNQMGGSGQHGSGDDTDVHRVGTGVARRADPAGRNAARRAARRLPAS